MLQFNRKISTNQQKKWGFWFKSDWLFVRPPQPPKQFQSARTPLVLRLGSWTRKWHQIRAQPTMEDVFPSCIDFIPKRKCGKVFKSCKAALRWNLWNFNQDFTFRFQSSGLQIQSACFFLFLQSRLLLLSHSKWRGMESSWELPIVSLQQTHVYAWCAKLFNRLWPIKDNQMFICQLFVQSHCSLFARPPSEHVSVAWKASPACLPCARKIVKNGQRVTWWYPTGWFIKTSFIDWSSIHIHEVPRRQATSPILDRPRKLCN